MSDKYFEAIKILQDKIREIFLRNSKVREFELKDGAKVGYRVTGIEEGEKAVKEISTLIPVQQGEVIASGKYYYDPNRMGMHMIGDINLGDLLWENKDKYNNKQIELSLKEKR